MSGTIYLAWRDEALFVRIDVTDDIIIGCPRDKAPYLSDGVEVFIDGRAPDMQWQAERTLGTIQYILSPMTDDFPSRLMIFGGSSVGHQWETRPTENGYIIEGRIPLTTQNFPAGSFTENRPIKLAVHLLDRDKGAGIGPSKILAWGATISTGGNNRKEAATHADTTGWNLLTLGK